MHFSSCDFSEIAKPKVNSLIWSYSVAAHAFRSLQIIMQNDYLRIEDMLSLISHKWSIIKYVVLMKIFFLSFSVLTVSFGLDSPGLGLDKGGLDYSPTVRVSISITWLQPYCNISADVPLMLHECRRVYLICFHLKTSFVKSLHLQYIAFIHCSLLEWYSSRSFTTECVNLLWDVYQIFADVTLKIESDAFQMMHSLTDILMGHTYI